jgi:ribosomal protein S18 acetylase RimI-like enzyme
VSATGASDAPAPRQLRMWRPHLDDLPPLEPPAGYRLRTYRPGDERAWARIMESEGGIGREWSVEKVRERLIDRPQFEEDGLYFATAEGGAAGERVATADGAGDPLVASACAWRAGPEAGPLGNVHMVCALPAYRGLGLGRLVTLAVLHHLRRRGFRSADLSTDDFRLAAIKTYLGLGFVPQYLTDTDRLDDHEARWSAVFARLLARQGAPDGRGAGS